MTECAQPNCENHGKSRCEGIRCDGSEAPTGQWAELLGPERVDQYEMVARDEVRVGDVVFSSHYSERTVTDVIRAGDTGQTTELRFGTWTDGTGRENVKNERYDSDSPIPRRRRSMLETVEYLVQWQRPLDDSYNPGEWEDTVTRETLGEAEEAARHLVEVRSVRVVRRTIAAEVVATFEKQD